MLLTWHDIEPWWSLRLFFHTEFCVCFASLTNSALEYTCFAGHGFDVSLLRVVLCQSPPVTDSFFQWIRGRHCVPIEVMPEFKATWIEHKNTRGVVVWERGGTLCRQIFWSRNGAPANIVGHRWNANTEAFRQITSYSLGYYTIVYTISLFSGPNCPQVRHLASKISKKNFRGRPPPTRNPQHGYMPCAGMQAPPLLGPRSRKPFPQIKIYHYTPAQQSLVSFWPN